MVVFAALAIVIAYIGLLAMSVETAGQLMMSEPLPALEIDTLINND